MASNTDKPLDVQLAESQEKVGEMETQLIESQDKVEVLEAQLAETQEKVKVAADLCVDYEGESNKLKTELAKAENKIKSLSAKPADKPAKPLPQGKLEKALECQISEHQDKIDNLLIKAKYVEKKGFKLQTNIVMKTPDAKTKTRLTTKLESMISEYKDSIKTLIVRAVHTKDEGFRVRVSIVPR